MARSDLPVQALVTTGPAVADGSLPSAPNVTVCRWLPHAGVLPEAALVITHGGHSTVTKALTYGVPLLCIPLGRDQSFIAERVRALGAGLTASLESDVAALTSAISTLVRDDSYREAARRVADAIRRAGPGAVNAADAVEAIITQRQASGAS